jgi:hypothetical protein
MNTYAANMQFSDFSTQDKGLCELAKTDLAQNGTICADYGAPRQRTEP